MQCSVYWTLISWNSALFLLDFDIKKRSDFFIGLWCEEMQCFFVGLWEQETPCFSYWTSMSTKAAQCCLRSTLISRNAELSLLDFDIKKHSAFYWILISRKAVLSLFDFDQRKRCAFLIGLWCQQMQPFPYWILISRNAVLSLLNFNIKKIIRFCIGPWYHQTQYFLV